jgi:hypothetical protein
MEGRAIHEAGKGAQSEIPVDMQCAVNLGQGSGKTQVFLGFKTDRGIEALPGEME